MRRSSNGAKNTRFKHPHAFFQMGGPCRLRSILAHCSLEHGEGGNRPARGGQNRGVKCRRGRMCGGICSQVRAGKQHGTYLHHGCGLQPCGGGGGGARARWRGSDGCVLAKTHTHSNTRIDTNRHKYIFTHTHTHLRGGGSHELQIHPRLFAPAVQAL